MSRTVVIMIVSWLCIFSVSEATLGESCNETVHCTATVENCTADGSCVCSSGYFDVSGVCNSSSITVSLSLQPSSAVYGSNVVLTATITSEVPLNPIKWLNGSKELNISSLKYTQSGVGPGQVTLNIKNVDFTDSGNYQVEVSNIAGNTSISNKVSLTVTGGKPTVTVPGTITEAATTVTIDCAASGSPAVTAVYWSLGGQNLTIAGNAKYSGGIVSNPSLTINNIESTDAGVYHCGATNLLGSTTSTKSVTLGKPTVTVPGTITEAATTVTIDCAASGSPAVTAVYWSLGGQNLTIAGNAKYSGGIVSNPSLTINNIESTDAGVYHCGATNLLGSTTSTKSVTLAPPSSVLISQQPANPVYNGTKITVSGSYISTSLKVKSIKWQRMNGNAFSDIDITADKYKESTDTGSNPTLVITKVDFSDKTSFRLTVSNGVGIVSSEAVSLNVIDGSISVTLTTPLDSARYGSDLILTATITSIPSVNPIKWQKVPLGGTPIDLSITPPKYSQIGAGPGPVTLTIHNVNFADSGSYQVEVSNLAGTTSTSNLVSFSVREGQFNESCTNQQPCNTSQNLECTTINRCRCKSAFYHKDQVCNEKTRLVPTNIFLNSTTSGFSVFWNNPTTDYELVSGYEVNWKVPGGSWISSNRLGSTVNKYTPSSNLIPGQLYTVHVISHVTLTNPADSFVVNSSDETVRTVPSAPGPIKQNESNFAHNNLQIIWTAPANTIVTKYEGTIDGTPYTTINSDAMYQFTGEVYIPGKRYLISIVTVSGTTDVKRSSEHTEWIRITPTKPNPPTDLRCPQNPLDISLEISWTAPTEPNGLIFRYLINVSPGNLLINTSSNETHKNVGGLLQEQMYNFTIRTINDAAINYTSEPSEQINCTTKAGVSSSPTNLVLDEIQSRGFRINFTRPVNVSGVLAAYKIVISEEEKCVQQILVHGHCSICTSTVGCPPPKNYTVPDINNNDVSYSASGLDPYTHYKVKVVAVNGNGEGHPVSTTVITKEEVPLQPVQITASNIQSSSLTLAWTLPDPSPGNTTYTIYTYEGTDDIGTMFLMKEPTKVYGFDTKSVSLTNLEEYWPYKFTVDAATVKGNKTSNFSSVFRTEQDTPGKVLNLTIQKKGSDYKSAYVSWSPPALRDRNGVLQNYLFSNNHTGTMKEEEIPVSLSQAVVEKKIPVTPEAVYVVEVILQNNESSKSQTSMQIYEAPAGPPPVTNIQPVTTKPGQYIATENTITIDINTEYFKNNENGKQVFFGIAVCAESKCEDIYQNTFRSVWKGLPTWREAGKEGFPLYRVTNDTFMDEVRPLDSRQKRSTISASTLTFTIGEDITCSSLNEDVYCNGPLTAGTSYIVIIFACTNGGCTYNKTAEPYVTKKIEQKTDIPIGIISGVVVAVVVVLVIVGVAFVVVRRRNRLGETKQYQKGIDNPTTFDEPVPKNIPRKRPIKLKELSDKVADKHKDSNLHFAREYEDLKALSPKHIAETSELDSNKLKNRYVNILPFDHSRVKLMLTEDDDPSTDFINANYLPGYKSQREYIATQGPIPGTIDDFWRMIWEQNVSIIVMLTLCKEEGRVKCEMYWPENNHEPKQYGDLVVETVSNSTVNFYDFRIFKIKLGDTTRSVKHFHFLQWKDFSANVQNDVMIDFIKNVRNHIRPPDMNGPVVVHCSAGVGRTGTYCALDHLFQFVDEHDLDESIDIFDLVMNLRERRMFMVQTEQQYVFIHDCVRDYVERKKKSYKETFCMKMLTEALQQYIFIHDCLKDYLEKKLSQGKDECLYENQAFVADDEPMEESLYQNYSNQRTDL